jgi:UDP-2,4-diacetamido-2,4,6-trideoxy-beta-L-altropyranose hydrolase
MKYLFFRVDSSYSIASGHLIRCQRLAKKFSNEYEVIFITNKFKGNFNFILKDFKKIYLDYKNEKFLTSKNDSEKIIKILKKFEGTKILFVDHYKLNYVWHKKIRKHVNKLICINDYIRKNYCDYLISETYYPNKVLQKCLKKNTKLFIGPKYALIDNIKKKTLNRNGIFIFCGSVDKKNVTLKLSKILKKITNKKIFVVIGKKNKNKNKILNIKKKNFFKIYKYINLSLYLGKCDVAIIAGGSVIWETLFNKMRTIVIPTAKNQNSNIKYLQKDKIIEILPFYKLNENAIKLILQKKTKQYKNIVDGNGINRVYKELAKTI